MTRARARQLAGRPYVVELSADIYGYIQPDGSWWINNAGFFVGRHGVVSVDTCATEGRAKAYRAAIEERSAAPIRTLVNTHHHGDHTFGNYLFPEATVVAHRLCREEMMRTGLPGASAASVWDVPDWGALESAPPFLTYSDGVEIWVDTVRCEVSHVGTPAHTTNDSVVWMPDHGVLFAGDLLMKGGTPFLLGGSLGGFVEAVTALRKLGATTIVPGHGPVCGAEVIDDVLAYLDFVHDLALRASDAGLTPLEAARECDLGAFSELLDVERIVGNLHRAYAELPTGDRWAVVDRQAALADMVAYNGGRPLTCLA